MRKNLFLLGITICAILSIEFPLSFGQVPNSQILTNRWEANWITVPETDPNAYGIYYFRKGFELTSIPESYPVYVSADNRYK